MEDGKGNICQSPPPKAVTFYGIISCFVFLWWDFLFSSLSPAIHCETKCANKIFLDWAELSFSFIPTTNNLFWTISFYCLWKFNKWKLWCSSSPTTLASQSYFFSSDKTTTAAAWIDCCPLRATEKRIRPARCWRSVLFCLKDYNWLQMKSRTRMRISFSERMIFGMELNWLNSPLSLFHWRSLSPPSPT